MFKRMMALVLMMMLCCTMALADSDAVVEFRSIPWGTSVLETCAQILQAAEEGNTITAEAMAANSIEGATFLSVLTDWKGDMVPVPTVVQGQCFKVAATDRLNMKIAGHDVDVLWLGFVEEQGEWSLSTVIIGLNPGSGVEPQYQDLSEKLTRLYGDSHEKKGYVWWMGQDNTMVGLVASSRDAWYMSALNADASLCYVNVLMYAKVYGMDAVDSMVSNAALPAVTADPNDLNGL